MRSEHQLITIILSLFAAGCSLVLVPAGEFLMGSDDGDFDERPLRTEYTDAFWIDMTEVTQGVYARCTDCVIPDCFRGDDEHPVVRVDWDAARTNCEWAGRRLLTEKEWEKAGRVLRGGGYFSTPHTVHAAKREVLLPLDKNDSLGFRCGASAE